MDRLLRMLPQRPEPSPVQVLRHPLEPVGLRPSLLNGLLHQQPQDHSLPVHPPAPEERREILDQLDSLLVFPAGHVDLRQVEGQQRQLVRVGRLLEVVPPRGGGAIRSTNSMEPIPSNPFFLSPVSDSSIFIIYHGHGRNDP